MNELISPPLLNQQCPACRTPYQPDAQFCDHCGLAVVGPAEQYALQTTVAADSAALLVPHAAAGAQALELVRALVRDKTRFEPEDLQQQSGEDLQQPLTLTVEYALESKLVNSSINGANFSAGSNDHRSNSCFAVDSDAMDDSDARLQVAHARLAKQLNDVSTAYNAVSDGRYLGWARRHWHLDTCSPCRGAGRVTCHTCRGRRSETCDQCNGAGTISCTNWGCFGGKVNCNVCSGSGSTNHSESYTEPVSVSTTVYHNGESHTSYHTEYQMRYRTVSRSCTACSYGKITCHTCYGTSRVNCLPCNTTGSITCRTCRGAGDLQCGPCSGSGQTGEAAWIEVHVGVNYALVLPDGVPDDVRHITDATGPHGAVAIADQLVLQGVAAAAPLTGRMRADYQLLLRIVRLGVVCSAQEYRLVAYGLPLAWLTLDDIVEDLLRQDLRALSQALAQVADDGLLAADVAALLQPLHAVAASELNADVIESILDGGGEQAHGQVVSGDYAQEVRTAVLGALRHIYTRQAKHSWWHGAIATAGVTLLVWLFSQLVWAMLAGLAVTAGSLLLFRYRIRRLLSDTLGGASQADRAIGLATRSKRQRLAYSLILGPALLALLLLGRLLPVTGPLAAQKMQSQTGEVTGSAGKR